MQAKQQRGENADFGFYIKYISKLISKYLTPS